MKLKQLNLKTDIAGLLAGTIIALCFAYLSIRSQSYAQASLFDLWISCGVAAASTFAVWWWYQKQNRDFPLAILWGFAILYRAMGVWSFPVLEDDMYRYLWDAYVWMERGSPYAQAPAAFFDDDSIPSGFQDILSQINYPFVGTVYGPVCQWLFALAYWTAPGEIWPLQILLSVADLALIAVLLRLTSSTNVLLYAWCPLVIKEFAFSAHTDVLGVLLMMMAVLAWQKNRRYRVAILMALAVGVKVFALLFVPFLLRFQWKSWSVFTGALIVLGAPFGIVEAWFPDGLREMGGTWLFNAPLYILTSSWVSMSQMKVVLGAGFLIAYSWYFWRSVVASSEPDPYRQRVIRGDWLFGGLLLIATALNPWYLVWLLAFAVIYPSRWAWTASVAVLLSYASGINLKASGLELYQHQMGLLILEFGLIAIALYLDVRSGHFVRHSSSLVG